MTRWYVVEANHQKQNTAIRAIVEPTKTFPGFNAYLPTIRVKRRPYLNGVQQTQAEWVLAPMFFQFLFVEFDVDHDEWGAIRYQEGVKRIILNAKHLPVPVEHGLIEGLKDDEPRRLQLPDERLPRAKPDTAILVRDGPFEGRTGFVISCDGVVTVIRLEMMGGRYVPISIPRRDLDL